jgi:hypothetical protein
MKICPKCKIKKEEKEFSKNSSRKDGLQRICKLCIKQQDQKLYQKNKDKVKSRVKKYNNKIKNWFIEYKKQLNCEICLDSRYWVLEFHHLDPKQKDFNISSKINGSCSIEKIKKEISKCICVCSNCHKDIHFKNKLN